MTDFEFGDSQVVLASMSKNDIIESLTLNDVKQFLESLGVERIEVNEEKQYLICPTICHHPLCEAESMKLYWYQNNKIFRCYTECNEAMSIFELYRRYMELNYYPVTLGDAEDYVKNILHNIVTPMDSGKAAEDYERESERYKFSTNIPQLPAYPKTVLDYFVKYYHPSWLREGITKEVMDKFDIRFWIAQNKIIIPHYDMNGRLIGIRGRALNEDEIEEYGKYRPIQIGKTLYTYPLQFNLYGLDKHKDAIRKRRCAIISEGEKSVLLDSVYYGDFSNTVACCGSSINKYHISMLADLLGVNEIVIAFDKEYEKWPSDKAAKYRKKLETICKKYKNQVSFSYIWDYDNLLREKDSPFDRGKDIFEELFKNRVKFR